MWTTLDPKPLNRETLDRLLLGELPVIRIRGFGTPQEAEELCQRFLAFGARSNSVPTVTRIGISQYEQGLRNGKDNYFRLVESAVRDLETIAETTFNPVTKMMSMLRALAPDTDIAHEDGYGRYFAGVAKLRTGVTPLHSDFPQFGQTHWYVSSMEAQLSWNFYLSIPLEGGELKVWDRFWQPEDDEPFLVKGSYHYRDAVVEGARSLMLRPTVGEVLILNARNYHTVLPCEHRVAVGSWISRMPGGGLRMWS